MWVLNKAWKMFREISATKQELSVENKLYETECWWGVSNRKMKGEIKREEKVAVRVWRES